MRARAAQRARLDRVLALALPPLSLALAVLAGAPSAGCRGVLVREPPRSAESPDPRSARCVDYPPPAAKVDEIPPPPDTRAVWLDGEWSWRVHRWIWEPGAWKAAPPGSDYVRPRLERLPNGALVWWAGHWHGRGGDDAEAPPSAPVADASAQGRRARPPCPPPPYATLEGRAGGPPSVPRVDAGASGSTAPPHEGPIRVYPADAPSGSGTVVLDAAIPADAAGPAPLIQPPS